MANQEAIVGGAVVAGIVAILVALRPYLLHKKDAAHGLAAGAQNIAFWEKRFDRLDTAIATLDRISSEYRGLTQAEIRDLRDLLVEIDGGLKVAIAIRTERRVR